MSATIIDPQYKGPLILKSFFYKRKSQSALMKGWVKRYFILDLGNKLFGYQRRESTKSKESLPVDGIVKYNYADSSVKTPPGNPYGFEIYWIDKSYMLFTGDIASFNLWMSALHAISTICNKPLSSSEIETLEKQIIKVKTQTEESTEVKDISASTNKNTKYPCKDGRIILSKKQIKFISNSPINKKNVSYYSNEKFGERNKTEMTNKNDCINPLLIVHHCADDESTNATRESKSTFKTYATTNSNKFHSRKFKSISQHLENTHEESKQCNKDGSQKIPTRNKSSIKKSNTLYKKSEFTLYKPLPSILIAFDDILKETPKRARNECIGLHKANSICYPNKTQTAYKIERALHGKDNTVLFKRAESKSPNNDGWQ